MKKTSLKRKTPLKRTGFKKRQKPIKRTRLKRASKKRSIEMRIYSQSRKAYMEEHPVCEYCGKAPATDLHHKAGRGKHYLTIQYFSSLCRPCHDAIHQNPNKARREGWIIDA